MTVDRPEHDGEVPAEGETPVAANDAEPTAPDPTAAEPAPAAAAAEAEIAELKDRLLRAVAEAENVRRRAQRDVEDARKFAAATLARDLLSVADNLQRALDAVPPDSRESHPDLINLLTGVELTERELMKAFEKAGIVRVDPMGEKLDPNLHQAMMQVPDPAAEPGIIVQVMQVGYKIHDRLLRPAMVGVAVAPAGTAGEQVDQQA